MEWYVSEIEFSLEQAEIVIEDRDYKESSNFALIAACLYGVNGVRKKTTDIIGEHPSKKREKIRQQQEQPKLDKEALRNIALNKGLNPNF